MKTRKSIKTVFLLIAVLLCMALSFACIGCDFSGAQNPDNNPSAEAPAEGNEPPAEAPSEGYEDTAWAENFTLPDAEGALNKLNELYGGAEKVFLLQSGRIARMPCPQGETITLNMTYEVGEYTKLVLEDSVAEFNEVFAVINPNYKFAINYSPSETDFEAKYSVRMSASDKLAVTETSQVFGLAHVGYYAGFTELGDFGITMKTEVLNNGSYLMTTFKHELMHLLGAGDAYNNKNATKDTVMQSYTVNGYHHLSKTDVAFLDTLYRNPELNKFEEKILGFVEAYEATTAHTQSVLTACTYQRLVNDLDPETVVSQAIEIGYKDLTEFSERVAGGIERDTAFGEKNISFTEIEYAKTQSETYFGSINPQTGKYWHGRQTTSGSSQGIDYRDYGSGVLYAAPNGSLYTILIKVSNYVLTFRLSGSFKNFSALSLDLWHISK